MSRGAAYNLTDEGRGGGGLVLPRGGQHLLLLVVARKPVDTGLDQNQPELGVLVLPVDTWGNIARQ